ncbi:MAG: hypothetical protein ACLFQB_00665 [Chitinispirillaceae bacterium]
MRLSKWSLILACFVFTTFAQESVKPTKNEVGIYENRIRETYEEPIFTVGPSDYLDVVKKKGDHYKIETSSGQEGWVEKNLVSAVSSDSKSRSFVFEDAEVIGYLDNPTPVYIMDMDDPDADPINLDRSFKEALKENVDKETIQRLAR